MPGRSRGPCTSAGSPRTVRLEVVRPGRTCVERTLEPGVRSRSPPARSPRRRAPTTPRARRRPAVIARHRAVPVAPSASARRADALPDQGGSLDDRSRRHQRLRPHRPPVPQGAHRAGARRRGRRRQRPRRRATNALLFKHDSTYGAYPGEVSHTDDAIVIDGREIKVLQVKDPAQLPWGDLGVDIVIESTGIFTDAEKAARPHRRRARRRSSSRRPAKNEDITIVLGVNEEQVRPREPPHHQQRVVHHELPRARREGRPRPVGRSGAA